MLRGLPKFLPPFTAPELSPVDRKALQDWYRTSMQERVRQLEELRPGLRRRDLAVMNHARDIGHGLKGSGGSFGFPAVTEAGAMVADSPDDALARRTEGLIALLRHVAWPDDVEKHKDYAWLAWAAGVTPPTGSDAATSWRLIAERAGLSEEELAGLASDFYGLPTGVPLTPTPQALHLVPEAVIRTHALLPLSEDDLRIRVAPEPVARPHGGAPRARAPRGPAPTPRGPPGSAEEPGRTRAAAR